jgi:acetyl esterase
LSTHLLTPAMAGLLDAHRTRPPHALPPAHARAGPSAYLLGAEVLEPAARAAAPVQDLTLPGGDGGTRPARLYAAVARAAAGAAVPARRRLRDRRPRNARQPVPAAGAAQRLCGAVAGLPAGARAPFPAAVDDTWAALRHLAGHADALGLDGRAAVGGDSAGGTLAAVAALHARDAGLPLALQLLITPGTAAFARHRVARLFANGFLLDAAAIAWFFDHYVPYHHRRDWRFAPLLADDVDGVAPACVILAECDPLVDEGLAYADRCALRRRGRRAGAGRGVTHDFIKMGRVLKEAHVALDAAARRPQRRPCVP